MKILVTGTAGFIGMHTAEKLLARGDTVIGLDNMNDYYDVTLKKARLARLMAHPNYRHVQADLADRPAIENLFAVHGPERVIHLAAQAGVRYSKENPHAYSSSNLEGFLNVLEGCRHFEVKHLVFASTSSVYGGNTKMPYSETDATEHPLTFYAATKKANEMMAHSYAHLYRIPCTGLRFFTVYGPWGRPDMSPWLFTSAILEGRTIDVFNHGKMQRDFTYIDDIVEGTLRVLDHAPTGAPPYHLYNIGNHQPVELMDFIGTLERVLGVEAKKNFMPMQPGDVPVTYADTEDLRRDVGFAPSTPLSQGLQQWADWYRSYVPR